MLDWAIVKRAAGAAMVAATMGASAAATQEVEAVGVHNAWSVYQVGAGAQRICWIRAAPSRQDARRSGQRVSVNRGETFLTVAARPGDGVRNEVSTQIGYTFRAGSEVRVDIGSNRFTMFTDGDKAWPNAPADDDRIVDAMRRGAEAVLTGVSSRGTTTIDTYSLIGFTAALDQAQGLCR
jgi:invasion protein IalB